MLQAYIDDSGTGGPLVVMAGFAASAEKWAAFSTDWDAVRKSGRPIRYLKMKEAFARTGEFLLFSEQERDQKILDLIGVINRHAVVSAVCVIDGNAYKQQLDGGPARTLDTPYFHACMTIMRQFMTGVRQLVGPGNPIDFIFDRMNPRYLQEVVQMWSIFKEHLPPASREMLGNQHPRMDDGEKLLPLEAAELSVGCFRRAAAAVKRGDGYALSKGKFIGEIKIPVMFENFRHAELVKMRQMLQMYIPPGYREESYERKARLEAFFNANPDLR